ncbi:hypothetical protein I5M27_05330 [Adhaeribacter sp. BT258]|uniref:Uncharacterized protein n=1 Tax=Adhaeribacter terrigena TaxID=2793070 RepID=A0ABS1BZQ4_9BACT|nr:hypothetical protein [Adhaeribacter terrigena]MBK0402396.1 hypothetical protein [Adhaeribacter terrigena]
MKQLFILLFFVGFTYSCTNETDRIPATEIQEAAVAPDLKLDPNNQKWRADEPTSASIESMQQLMNAFDTGKNVGDIVAFQELGKTMNGEMNTLFRQCTMTGPAHDELHTFLTPIMKDVKILQGSNIEASTAAQLRLKDRLAVFQTFFE